ncbi:hypothetical protein A176_001287 [Myxococcus hansupus]|uniref:Uncharacterized protein n=1 Tax=Pseudomyxococcus hansupus TaxID=1297742 RepID=A0A0H4WSP0_9BACT|nr:hypothetical protein A176_001287 [Myxococcus hansupus]
MTGARWLSHSSTDPSLRMDGRRVESLVERPASSNERRD